MISDTETPEEDSVKDFSAYDGKCVSVRGDWGKESFDWFYINFMPEEVCRSLGFIEKYDHTHIEEIEENCIPAPESFKAEYEGQKVCVYGRIYDIDCGRDEGTGFIQCKAHFSKEGWKDFMLVSFEDSISLDWEGECVAVIGKMKTLKGVGYMQKDESVIWPVGEELCLVSFAD